MNLFIYLIRFVVLILWLIIVVALNVIFFTGDCGIMQQFEQYAERPYGAMGDVVMVLTFISVDLDE